MMHHLNGIDQFIPQKKNNKQEEVALKEMVFKHKKGIYLLNIPGILPNVCLLCTAHCNVSCVAHITHVSGKFSKVIEWSIKSPIGGR